MKDWYWSLLAFVMVSLLGYGAHRLIGRIYGSAEARELIETLTESGLYLGSASATASATTLALMLTLIGMVRRSDESFDAQVYRAIDRIAQLATASLMCSLALLLAMVFPVGEFDKIDPQWYPTFYKILFASTVLTVALLAATVTMVYQTVRHVISKITPGDNV